MSQLSDGFIIYQIKANGYAILYVNPPVNAKSAPTSPARGMNFLGTVILTVVVVPPESLTILDSTKYSW